MKYLYISVVVLLLVACNKTENNDDNRVDENTIPRNASVATTIHVFLEINTPGTPNHLVINNEQAFYAYGNYSTNDYITSDVYKSETDGINAFPGPAVCPVKFFALSQSPYSYVDVKNINHGIAGALQASGSEFALPGGGRILYGPTSFNFSDGVYFTYVNPAEKKYAISIPDLTVDSAQRRWLLESYGTYYINLPSFKAGGAPVKMEYPIPAALLPNAPDNVSTWLFSVTENKWVHNGLAVKVGNKYQFNLTKEGIWNIAKTVKGLYKSIRLRTDGGAPVVSAPIRFMASGREVGAVRTDADGNAHCFLPTDEAITAEILFNWKNSNFQPAAFTLPVSAFKNNNMITLTIPASSPYVASMKGTLKTCSGGNISQGTVRVMDQLNGVLRGHFTTGGTQSQYSMALVSFSDYFPLTIRATDVINNQTGRDTTINLRTGQENIINFRTCQ